jgi:protein TonB
VQTAPPLVVRASEAREVVAPTATATSTATPTSTPIATAAPPEPPAPVPAPPARPAAGVDVPLPPPPRGTELVQDAPAHPTGGFTKPRLAEPGCVQASLRLPRDAAGLAGETATIRFAVGPDGVPSRFQLVAGPADPRVGAAIWSAVQRCEFLPGTDGQGRPALLWLVMPLRFAR